VSNNNEIKTEKEIDQISTNSANNSEQEDSGNNSDKSDIPDNKNSEKRVVKEKNTVALQFGKKIKIYITNYRFLVLKRFIKRICLIY